MMHKSDVSWTIRPSQSILHLRFAESWEYRDLLMLLVKRDFVSFYKQTIFGPMWFFIQPLFTTLMFTLVFGNLAAIPTDGLPKPLFYLAGITAWNYFSECLSKTSTVFRDNAALFGKVYFPRLIIPLSIVVSNLIRFCIQMILFLIVCGFYKLNGADFNMTWAAVLFPVIVVLMAFLGLGSGMIISAMTTKYRDLAFLIAFGLQLLMYAAPVIYPLSVATAKYPSYSWIIEFNPMTAIIETFRYGFLGQGTFSWINLGYSAAITAGLLFCGIIIFNKVERTFVDTI